MTEKEAADMYPSVPFECFIHHDWRDGVESVGAIPSGLMVELSGGYIREELPVKINRCLLEPWDLIVSIGQVVPHEVAGLANYTKNIVIGCGGKEVIDRSHIVSALFGIEKTLGEPDTPVRTLLDYAQENLLGGLPLLYVLTVTGTDEGSRGGLAGIFAGTTRSVFEKAADLCRRESIHYVREPLEKVVVYLDPKKFKTTWLGNKAIYRTRMALAEGAELLVLAPGVRRFGEDGRNDELIRKYGYKGTREVLELLEKNADLKENLGVAAHLIHGSSEGRFTVRYAVRDLTEDEIESVGYEHAFFDELSGDFDIEGWTDGFKTTASGEAVYYIADPAVALWKASKGGGA